MVAVSSERHSGSEVRSDFLVIGAGLAGLSFALRVAEHGDVVVLCKAESTQSNTAWAQGGIAAVWDPDDSIEAHVEDTLVAGAHLARREDVEDILAEGPAAVRRLIELGVRFSRRNADADEVDADGYSLTREGGHHARRILHYGDATGREIQRAILEAAGAHPRIRLIEHQVAIDLITERTGLRHLAKRRLGLSGPEVEQIYGPGGPEGWVPGRRDRCLGAYVLDAPEGRVRVFSAPVTLLATGGCGKLYRFTSNPDLATGDGMAMAYRAGAMLANLEFVQFHPTCLYHHSPEAKSFLISEALRGEGGILRLPDGTAFMDAVHPMGSLAPRDITARAIDAQIKRHGLEYVHLDVSHLDAEFLRGRFPAIHARLSGLGIDMTAEPIPVVPAAHYFCGGVKVDGHGRTRIDGLLAAGEVACTGLHGANRLASNSLIEAAVVGERAARAAVAARDAVDTADHFQVLPWDSGEARDADELVVIAHTWDEIRRLMWNYVGIVRTDRRLQRALRRVKLIRHEIRTYYWDFKVTRDLIEVRNLALLADLVIRSALGRRESRGLHFTLDHPESDDDTWRRDTLLRREW
jgi:L-aspartate oxidase